MSRYRVVPRLLVCASIVVAGGSCTVELPPTENHPPETAAPAPLPSAQPLPDEGFRVEWVANTMPPVVKAGSNTRVQITVKNAGIAVWPDLKAAGNKTRGAVRIGYRWLPNPSRNAAAYARARGNLPSPLAPGQSATLALDVIAPLRPGRYRLQFDLVQEFVAWFESKDATRLIIPVRVVE